jgi:uncharacterized BrkB/YihY/UPF0761 family membrane protein
VNPLELAVGIGLIALVVAVAGFFLWRQFALLRTLRHEEGLAGAERHYLRQQARRRLLNSILMLLFAGLLVGGFFLFPPEPTALEAPAEPDEIAKESIRLFTAYWILALLVLLAILALAVVDLWATARFGFQHQKQLEQDRRAMLVEEARRLRRRRQEMN